MSACFDDNLALALVDGKLPPQRREEVESHLESCPMCRELVAALARDDLGGDSQSHLVTQASELGEVHATAVSHTVHAPGQVLRKADSYKIEREVGSGSAGTVFRAVDERTGEVVALKYVTDPAWRSRFRREVETLSRLVHPGIVRYIAHGETRQGLYLVMEWLDGEDLAQCIERGPIPWPGVRALGLRLTAALAHAHGVEAVHRDLGPRNVFLPAGRLEQAKLLDFGLVRVPDALDRTGSQAVLGTPQYMAPEQVRDPRNVDARSDIFSLGSVFFEALSGVRPFDANDLFTVWNKIVGHPPPNLRQLAPTVPEGFVSLIERMLAKDPAQRPQTAAAIHEALVRLDAPATDLGTAVQPPMAAPLHNYVRSTAPMNPQPSSKPPVGKSTTPLNPVPREPKEIVGKATAPIPRNLPLPPSSSRSSSVNSSAPTSAPTSAPITQSPPTPAATSQTPIIIATTLLASVIVIATTAIVVGPRLLERKADANANANANAAPVTEPSPAPAPTPEPAPEPEHDTMGNAEQLVCGGHGFEKRSGGHYQGPAPEAPSVTIGGDCKALLEDCVIGGKRSVLVMNKGDLTLHRCKVLGDVELTGPDVTLTLDETTLPHAPKIVGKGRVIRR